MVLMLVPLSIQVSMRRAKMHTLLGDGGDEILQKRIRAHGNFIEFAPLALIALGLMEYRGAASWLVWLLGAGFLVSRILHAIAMLFTSTRPLRMIAMLTNHAGSLTAGIWLVAHSI